MQEIVVLKYETLLIDIMRLKDGKTSPAAGAPFRHVLLQWMGARQDGRKVVDLSLCTLLISRVAGPLSSLCIFPLSESSVSREPTSFCPRRHSATGAAPEH